MEKLEKVHGLMDELTEAVKELFPDLSNISVCLNKDGYMSIDVIKWAGDKKVTANTPEKYLLVQCCVDGRWSDDWSKDHNKYLADHGLLLVG